LDNTAITIANKSQPKGNRLFFGPDDLPNNPPGKPTKSVAQIRAALKSVEESNDRDDNTGPLRNGLGKLDWVALETYRNQTEIESCCAVLARRDIECQLQRRGKDTIVYVRKRELAEARPIAPRRNPETRENYLGRLRRLQARIASGFILVFVMLCSFALATILAPTFNTEITIIQDSIVWMIIAAFIISKWSVLQWLLRY